MRVWRLSVLGLGLAGCVSGLGTYDVVLNSLETSPGSRRVYLKGETELPLPPGLESRGSVRGSYHQPRTGHSSQRALVFCRAEPGLSTSNWQNCDPEQDPMGFTHRLAQFALDNNSFDRLPAEVVDRSKEMMVNAAAVALAAAAQPEGRTLTQFVQEMQGNGKCTIIGMGLRTSPIYAALANGTMIHLLDFDDEIFQRGVHPSSTVLPVVLALGELNGYAGKDVLSAYALGCEVIAKLGGICDPVWPLDSVAGNIGATVAAALLLGLEGGQIEGALGIACGEAGGIQANLATGSRALQCGRAAMNGIMAATLAQRGFTGATGSATAPNWKGMRGY